MVAETASIIGGGVLINKLVTRLYFILTITWSLAYVVCKHRTDDYKKIRQIDDNFDGHAAGVRCASPDGAHSWLHVKPLDAAIG